MLVLLLSFKFCLVRVVAECLKAADSRSDVYDQERVDLSPGPNFTALLTITICRLRASGEFLG